MPDWLDDPGDRSEPRSMYSFYTETASIFEFDEAKSRANKRKHGIDFIEAQGLWLDERRHRVPARSDEEEREVTVARWMDAHWAAFTTRRGNVVRIISVRRARPKEIARYEGQ